MKKTSNEKAWKYALNMIKVDGLEPTKDLLDLVEEEKKGKITTDEMRQILKKKYMARKIDFHPK